MDEQGRHYASEVGIARRRLYFRNGQRASITSPVPSKASRPHGYTLIRIMPWRGRQTHCRTIPARRPSHEPSRHSGHPENRGRGWRCASAAGSQRPAIPRRQRVPTPAPSGCARVPPGCSTGVSHDQAQHWRRMARVCGCNPYHSRDRLSLASVIHGSKQRGDAQLVGSECWRRPNGSGHRSEHTDGGLESPLAGLACFDIPWRAHASPPGARRYRQIVIAPSSKRLPFSLENQPPKSGSNHAVQGSSRRCSATMTSTFGGGIVPGSARRQISEDASMSLFSVSSSWTVTSASVSAHSSA